MVIFCLRVFLSFAPLSTYISPFHANDEKLLYCVNILFDVPLVGNAIQVTVKLLRSNDFMSKTLKSLQKQ